MPQNYDVVSIAGNLLIYTTPSFEDLLKQEINEDREAHGKRPLKGNDDDDDHTPTGGSGGTEEKTVKASTTDPESGWFRKGEHKNVFAYAVLSYSTTNRGNRQILDLIRIIKSGRR